MLRFHYIRIALIAAISAAAIGGCTDNAIAPPVEPPTQPDPPAPPVPDLAYSGSDSCRGCHEGAWDKWRQSGHPYKIIEVKNAQAPSFPFTKISQPPPGSLWGDVLYVVGGYGYKARYVGKDGFFITKGGRNQFDLNTNTWSDYSKDQRVPYNCGSCHTTGYSPLGNHRGIEGLVGTWQEDGIGCEACHGPGSQHVARPKQFALKVDRSIEACATCHNRNGATNPEITAQNGFLMHRDALHSIRNTPGHSGLTCVNCHDPHAGALFTQQRGIPAVKTTCEDCHSKARKSLWDGQLRAWKATAECTTCHMAPMTVSAVPTKRPWRGDMKSHLVKINTNAAAPQFYGTNNNRSHAYITVGFACLRCHETKSLEWAGENAVKVHGW